MTDQEYEKELGTLMADNVPKKKKKKKKKFIIGAAIVIVIFFVLSKIVSGGKSAGVPVVTDSLAKGTVEEILSISGPISGTDSAEVVSNLHAEILEILVKEGDKVRKDQVLARLDSTNVQREVDIAQNSYDLAVASLDEAQIAAENGYAKAVQDRNAAKLEYERNAVLFANGDVAQADLEKMRDALSEAERHMRTYTLKNGKAVASESYQLQVKNAEYELEQKKKQLEETEVKSPISGTVVRVNSRVGRFADTVDDDRPLFAIDNLENLEMKISVSEYSIGKVKLGQTAEISADILNGEIAEGAVVAISPTGEEKGGGSTERVIPTTIQITDKDTSLIAGITARAKIVLNKAEDVWVVPISAVIEREGNSYLAAVENNVVQLIPVEMGVESDVSVEVRGEGLREGLSYVITGDPTFTDGLVVVPIPQS